MQRYEYEYVRIDEAWMIPTGQSRPKYQAAIEERARQGWRLVQILAPPIGPMGTAKYYELVLEREFEGA